VAEELMAGVELDRQCLGSASTVRKLVRRWELPPGVSPRMELHASRNRQAPVTERRLAWDPHWKETPTALWLRESEHAIVSVIVPYVSCMEGRSDLAAVGHRQPVRSGCQPESTAPGRAAPPHIGVRR